MEFEDILHALQTALQQLECEFLYVGGDFAVAGEARALAGIRQAHSHVASAARIIEKERALSGPTTPSWQVSAVDRSPSGTCLPRAPQRQVLRRRDFRINQ